MSTNTETNNRKTSVYSRTMPESNTRMIAEREKLSAALAVETKLISQITEEWTEADMAAESQIRDTEYSHYEGLTQRIRRIDQALERISAGSYGYCMQCGRRIGQKRLYNDPTVDRCFRCQSASEVRERRFSW